MKDFNDYDDTGVKKGDFNTFLINNEKEINIMKDLNYYINTRSNEQERTETELLNEFKALLADLYLPGTPSLVTDIVFDKAREQALSRGTSAHDLNIAYCEVAYFAEDIMVAVESSS